MRTDLSCLDRAWCCHGKGHGESLKCCVSLKKACFTDAHILACLSVYVLSVKAHGYFLKAWIWRSVGCWSFSNQVWLKPLNLKWTADAVEHWLISLCKLLSRFCMYRSWKDAPRSKQIQHTYHTNGIFGIRHILYILKSYRSVPDELWYNIPV